MLKVYQPRNPFQAAIEAIAIGLALGLIDVHSSTGDAFDPITAYFITGFALGLRHSWKARQAWIPLGGCFYLAHRVAIASGYKPPYVERNAAEAVKSLYVLWPAGFGLIVGIVVQLVVTGFLRHQVDSRTWGKTRWDCHRGRPTATRSGSRTRCCTRSCRDHHRATAVFSSEGRVFDGRRPFTRLTLGVRALLVMNDHFFGFGTIYSERYSERRFNALRVGMTRGEVEMIIGPPLGKVPWNELSGPVTTRCGITPISTMRPPITGGGGLLRQGQTRGYCQRLLD